MFGTIAAQGLPIAAPYIQQAAQHPDSAIRTGKRAVARLAGLSGADLGALEQNGGVVLGLPGWSWGVAGIALGSLLAVYLCQNHPQFVPNLSRRAR